MAGNWKKTLDDLLYNGDLDGAYNLLDGILRDNSGDIKARIAFGKVQYELGDPDNARNTFETEFNKIIESDSNVDPTKIDKNDYSIRNITAENIAIKAKELLIFEN